MAAADLPPEPRVDDATSVTIPLGAAEDATTTIRKRRPVAPYKAEALRKNRFWRAYSAAWAVLGSYLWFRFKRRYFGMRDDGAQLLALHRRNARKIERTLLDLQGLYIKVGQALSIMANVLPAEFRDELEGMQDQVPPRPFSEIEARVVKELGKTPDELFARFDRTPLASASLGQVHEAVLKNGTRVAVKVQHHDIEEIARLDLIAIKRIMQTVQWFVPLRGLDNYYRQIRQLILQELDFRREARNITRISANFDKDANVVTPTVVADLSTQRVLTLTFVEGIKIGDLRGLDKAGIDRPALAQQLVHAFCQMIFVDGVYHADPHPGNILVDKRPDGTTTLVLLDFGAVAELSQPMREGIPEFLEGALRRDTDRLVRAMRKMGFLGIDSDEAMVEKVIDHFHRKFQDEVKLESLNLKDIKIDPQRSFDNLVDLRNMNVGLRELSSSIHIPREWVLLERTLVLLTGVCTQLDPEMSPLQIIRPYLEKFVLGNRDWTEIALEAVKDTALRAVGLPEAVHQYIRKSTRGEIEVRVRGVQQGFDGLYAIGRQAMYAGIAGFFFACSIALHLGHDDVLARRLLWPSGAFGLVFVIASLRGRPTGKR
ncbi:MAG: ABC1 kinase family protein [Polyangiales bacterium]